MVNPQVALVLNHNDTEIFNLPESGLRQRIINVYGKNLNQKLLSMDAQSSLVTISGFVGRPDSAKKRGALQYFFVNGRFMKHPYFHKAVMQAYEQLIPPGEQPNYFIYFTLDPSTIDVNIHPTKTEIKFENEQPIWQILMAATREALAKSSAIPTIDFDVEDAIDIRFTIRSKNRTDLEHRLCSLIRVIIPSRHLLPRLLILRLRHPLRLREVGVRLVATLSGV